jgi:hypothetical protein
MKTQTIARAVTVALMGLAVLVATADGFAQSYAGLYDAWPAKAVQSFKTPADGDWMSIAWTNPEAGGSVGWDVS